MSWRTDEKRIKTKQITQLLHDYWKACFVQVTEQIEVPTNTDLQRSGVDRRLICSNGHEILAEEKIRFRRFDRTVLLEEVHIPDDPEGVVRDGWARRDLSCHVMGYLWVYGDSSRFICLDFARLRSIYLSRRRDPWREISSTKNNNGYKTVSRLVPLSVLSDAVIYTGEGRRP